MRTVLKVLGVIGIVVLVLAVVVATFGMWTVRRSFPQVSGTIAVPGLDSPVEVKRDTLGIPQIYADNTTDLFYALGYVHSQDRFWEMDFRRHIVSGTLSEMFGESTVDTDKVIRTMAWRDIAEQEVALLSPESRRILDAYAAGVNQYISTHSKPELSLEYSVLNLTNKDYEVAPWEPADSVAWLKALAWDLQANMDEEVGRAVASSEVGIRRTEQLYPPYPFDTHRPILSEGAVENGSWNPKPAAVADDTMQDAAVGAAPEIQATQSAFRLLDSVIGARGEGIGSNSWVVDGTKTTTGQPLLANDPHLGPVMPSLWYQAGLHCRTVSVRCQYDLAGWTNAGVPGVLIGHNANIAWGFTNLGPDVADLVLEKVNGDKYLYDGQELPLEVRQETINVAGGDPVTITVRKTRNGPIMSDVLDSTTEAGQDAPVPAPGQDVEAPEEPRGDGYAVALHWTGLEPRPTFDAFDTLNTAEDWEQFRQAASELAVPSQNLIFADRKGNIGYQAPGLIPIRKGYNGKWPVPGWTSQFGWDGWIPFDALPWVKNPPEHQIVTANQAVTYPGYAYFLTDDWSYGARSQRIWDLLDQATADGTKVSGADLAAIQMDAWNEFAAFMAPRVRDFPVDEATKPAVALFDGWDHQQQADSAAGAYFNVFYRELLKRVFDDELKSSSTAANAGDRYWDVLYWLWDRPNNKWWDDVNTPDVEGRDETIVAALNSAFQDISGQLGSTPADWRWGDLHQLELTNASLGKSGIGFVEWLFNRGPYSVGGGSSIVQANGWVPQDGYGVSWVPSMRQIVDLSDFDASTWVNLSGNSGHAFNANYNDQTPSWVSGEQYPWKFSPQAVEEATAQTLTLQPQ